jgi:hypothetical protein
METYARVIDELYCMAGRTGAFRNNLYTFYLHGITSSSLLHCRRKQDGWQKVPVQASTPALELQSLRGIHVLNHPGTGTPGFS